MENLGVNGPLLAAQSISCLLFVALVLGGAWLLSLILRRGGRGTADPSADLAARVADLEAETAALRARVEAADSRASTSDDRRMSEGP